VAAELVKAALIDIGSLSRLTSVVKTAPDHLQTDCFNVYYYHLQKPIDRRRCENGSSLGYILVSVLGIVHLADHCSYFGRGQAHKQRLANSWSQILKWLNVIFDGHFFQGDEENWFMAVDGIFRALDSVGGEALDEDDTFEFAVDVWNGFSVPDDREYFSATSSQHHYKKGSSISTQGSRLAS